MRYSILCLLLLLLSCAEEQKQDRQTDEETGTSMYKESHRPQFHFSPDENWMNDPNGLVYHDGVYHLFYQYYPEDIVWGPMHWGHAVSKDLLHWEHKPVSLYPDELGYIFSGSAVYDKDNTSGLGTADNPPLVAVFTYHDPEKEKTGSNDHQTQGIAYSVDGGESWEKYEGNPVIGNEGIRDFRDPKVFWHDETEKWIMLLVAGDRLMIYNSDDLISWNFLSEFGKDRGAHGGVWECPDLFPLKVEPSGETKWVLLISINPGGPNGGSATQYFVGDFDGTAFTSEQQDIKWVDHGADNYAGVTYNHTPDGKRIFIGWMSNWNYAQKTPTQPWRSAMTLPRELSLERPADTYLLKGNPVDNLSDLYKDDGRNIPGPVSDTLVNINGALFDLRFSTTSDHLRFALVNDQNERMVFEFDRSRKEFLIDRSQSGNADFDEQFAQTPHSMPMPVLQDTTEIRLVSDWSSVELFIDGGRFMMTEQMFPNVPFSDLRVESGEIHDLRINLINRIWGDE
ncbi:glycoside hydrolase family 32 protein [Robertkochia aurantiaca]|uniref:glycoside hydrolase family 32 protein n=1 Tax=Robertkochia aurantiaca TaxID=2873700 RepID=UPI001CCD2B0C|nr:glycoside hydrolase family 32 protein [Robertkochia sp. 3YJGBD-33]